MTQPAEKDAPMPIRQALRLWAAMVLATSPRLRPLHRFVPRVAGRANLPDDTPIPPEVD